VGAPDVYETARGPLPRLAEPFAKRARAHRHARFLELVRPTTQMRIVDVGCGGLGLRGLAPELDITGVDLLARPGYPGPLVIADAAEALPFADSEFDLAYCNSVVEHVEPARREAFAAELGHLLDHEYDINAFSDLVLIAPPHFLGLLRKTLGGKLRKRVIAELDKDYTPLPLHDLQPRVEQWLQDLPPSPGENAGK